MKNLGLFICLFAFTISCGQAGSQLNADTPTSDYKIENLEKALSLAKQENSVVAKIDVASQSFLGLPYGGSLGEGENGELYRGPLFRGDSFNCTTLIETSLALAHAADMDSFKSELNRIRYVNGEIGFLTRNHFPDADWSKNNIALAYFSDITDGIAGVAGVKLETARAQIDRQTWFREFWETDTTFTVETYEIPYIAIKDLFVAGEALDKTLAEYVAKESEFIGRIKAETDAEKQMVIRNEWRQYVLNLDLSQIINQSLVDAIPNGMVANLVTPGWELKKGEKVVTGMNIGHQALIFVDNNGQHIVRDASLTWRQVSQMPLANYFFIKLTSSTQKGVNFLSIQK